MPPIKPTRKSMTIESSPTRPTYQKTWYYTPGHHILDTYTSQNMVSHPRIPLSWHLPIKLHSATTQNTTILIPAYQATWCHIPKHCNIDTYIPKNMVSHPRTPYSSNLHTKPHDVPSQNTILFKPTYQTTWCRIPEHHTLQTHIPNHMISHPRTPYSSNLHTKPHDVTSQNTILFKPTYQTTWCRIPEHHTLQTYIPNHMMAHPTTPYSSNLHTKPHDVASRNTIIFKPQGEHQISYITLNTSVSLHILTGHINEVSIKPSSLQVTPVKTMCWKFSSSDM